MNVIYRRHYAGPVRALITDLAGTVVDYGSCAPAGVFVELFRRRGLTISQEQAREPMGLQKKDHIRVISNMREVAAAWQAVHGSSCTEDDVERMYREFIPLQLEVLPRYGTLIPGTAEVLRRLREQGVRIAATTGYNREMMEIVLQGASAQGFTPDAAVCASDVPRGRPAPWMIFRSLEELDVYPPEAAVKIGDTLPDVEAGLNAGVWTIGVARTGNMLGLGEEEAAALPDEALRSRLVSAREAFHKAGAHYVVDSIADLLPVIEAIHRRLASNERP
jgi:phosphonoacetaldehyde hydrolase